MVRIVLGEYVNSNGKIITEASVYAEKTIRQRIEYLSEKYNNNKVESYWYPDYILLKPISDTDARLDDVKDMIISLVKQAIEEVRSLKHLEIILDEAGKINTSNSYRKP